MACYVAGIAVQTSYTDCYMYLPHVYRDGTIICQPIWFVNYYVVYNMRIFYMDFSFVTDEVVDTEIINEMDDRETEADLDPEILQILGDDPSNENKFGEDLHNQILPRWKHILAKGLDKEVKSELCKLYLPPENCGSLRAPKLNPQVRRFLSEPNKKKETFNESKQNQLSSCLAALGKSLNIALSNKGNAVPQDIIKPLSDAGRLLCDFHYRESQSRRYAIINVINKDMRETLKNTMIDEFLFGADLAEQLKQDKEITRVAMDLRTPRPSRLPAAGQVQRGTLNYRGARGPASAARQYPSQQKPPASSGAGAATSSRGRDHRRYESSSWRKPNGRGRTTRR